MSQRASSKSQKSRYGLPRNIVYTERPIDLPRTAEAWLEARDEFDGYLFDALDALHAGLLTRTEFDKTKARLSIARRKADARMQHLLVPSRARAAKPARRAW